MSTSALRAYARPAAACGSALVVDWESIDRGGRFGTMESDHARRPDTVWPPDVRGRVKKMNILALIIAIIAVILLFTGGFVSSLQFLLWIGIVLAVIAIIVWLVRFISGRGSRV
ncbi:hypothetical protein [Pseudolysinimonas kribbensis]|uniref:DUF2207 domain-containing protein n=1 Tax=Pseudolysinimonas kribbensis TaxID=433641 RepID=A0ABQ6K6K4_9MICO|nr:hypothetical protein [Pseudolysinimonas kribbensis]GMA95587.1 hypothetical protein GCM10025881_24110 [Pseudolysinimonas kribbensis]